MKNTPVYIFVHGAWHAAWCWQQVAQKMQMQGYQVLTPDLPGHGSTHHHAGATTFADYVACLIKLIQSQKQPVILVGHSMAGMVISQVAELIPDNILQLVYVAAYIPANNDSVLSLSGQSAARTLVPFVSFDQKKNLIELKLDEQLIEIFYPNANRDDAMQALQKLQSQPLLPFNTVVKLSSTFLSHRKKAIICQQDKIIFVQDQIAMSARAQAEMITLDADHSPFLSKQDELINAIILK